MGAESKWVVVFELPQQFQEIAYGVTSEEAMQVIVDNGPPGAKPLYAYQPDFPDVTYSWPWSN